MSYSCTYDCFDKKLADTKWQTEDLAKLVKYEDHELMIHDLELGSVSSVTLNSDDFQILVTVMDAHDIKIIDFPKLENIQKLLSSLDANKVHRALLSESSVQYEPEIRNGFDSVLSVVEELLSKKDPEETTYTFYGMEKYAVPLFEACGIFLYSTATRKQLVNFNDQFSQEVYEKTVISLLTVYENAINENNKDTQEILVSILTRFKKVVQLLRDNPELEFVFSDDETDMPQLFQNRLVDIKAKFNLF